jgi:hypothetical protein
MRIVTLLALLALLLPSFAVAETPGDRYDGEFRDGQMNGHGIYYFKSGNRYDGDWRDGRANGQGRLVTSDGADHGGIRRNGCLTEGHQRIAIDVDLSTCP